MRGTNPLELTDIDIVSSDRTQYTDIPPTNATWYYQVSVVLPKICAPAVIRKAGSGPFNRTLSNIKDLKFSGEKISFELSDTTLMASAPVGTLVGRFSVKADGNPLSMNYSLVTGPGDTHNPLFSLKGDSLLTNSVFPFDKNTVYSIRVEGTEKPSPDHIVADSFLLKVDRVVGMPRLATANTLTLHPNPFSGFTEISLPEYTGNYAILSLTDLAGKTLRREYVPEGTSTFRLERGDLPAGVYFINLTVRDQRYQAKLMVLD
jgi:hypothetical protein